MLTPPPSDRSMSAVLVRAFLFGAVGYVVTYALAYTVLGIWRGGGASAGGGLFGNAAIAAYVLLVTAVPAAFGFAIVTSPWPAFRDQSPGRVAWMSAAGGAAACLAQLTGVAGTLTLILFVIPMPGALAPIGAALRMIVPGIAVGVVALVAARLLRPRREPAAN
jgi:hypothetical protein